MVYIEKEIEVGGKTYLVETNVPFQKVSPRLVELVKGIDILDYGNGISWLNKNCFNVALLYEDEIVAFMWGVCCPVDRLMIILRVVVSPEHRSELLLAAIVDIGFKLGEEIGMKKVITFTDREDAWLRILKNKVNLSNAKVLEREL